MYLNGIKHNVVTKLNPLTLNVGLEGRMDGQMNAQMQQTKTIYPFSTCLRMPSIIICTGCSNQRGITLEKLIHFSEVNKVIYSLFPIISASFEALAQIHFKISC